MQEGNRSDCLLRMTGVASVDNTPVTYNLPCTDKVGNCDPSTILNPEYAG